MVAHLLWEQRVAGSNPVTPTNASPNQVGIAGISVLAAGWFQPKALLWL